MNSLETESRLPAEPQETGPRPLDGITVVSLEQAVAAPFCTRQLADMGARVIKVERPGTGDFARSYDKRVKGLSSHFVWTNRSKESLALNLKHEGALGVMEQLLQGADVLVQNLAPGAAGRMGLSFGALHDRHPRLIVCDISGYGIGGRYQDKKAYDLLIQSESGFISVTGTPDEPAKAGCSISDIAAGMYAYSSILNALILRGRTGKGSHLDVTMLESMVEWMGYPLYYAFDGAAAPARAGAAHSTIYPYGPFPVGNNAAIILGLQNEREWKIFCRKILRRPDLAEDPLFASNPERTKNRQLLHELIVGAFSGQDIDSVAKRLDEAGIANARLNEMSDVWQHPQLRERGRWRTVGTPAGSVPALLPPAGSNAFTPRMDPVPALGEHTGSILAGLGYTRDQVEELRAAGAL